MPPAPLTRCLTPMTGRDILPSSATATVPHAGNVSTARSALTFAPASQLPPVAKSTTLNWSPNVTRGQCTWVHRYVTALQCRTNRLLHKLTPYWRFAHVNGPFAGHILLNTHTCYSTTATTAPRPPPKTFSNFLRTRAHTAKPSGWSPPPPQAQPGSPARRAAWCIRPAAPPRMSQCLRASKSSTQRCWPRPPPPAPLRHG